MRRFKEISSEIRSKLNIISKQFIYFSLALGETTDIKNTAQLPIFIRDADSQFNVTEAFLDFVSLKDTTIDGNIKEAIIDCMQINQLNLKHVIDIVTDGVLSMANQK